MIKIKELDQKLKNKSISKKRIVIIVLALIILSVLAATVMIISGDSYQKKVSEWSKSAITSPKAGSLQAAGYITITWKPAEDIGKVKAYKLYVNDNLIAEMDSDTTNFEYHCVEVKAHKVYVEADMKNGSKIYSNIFTFYVNKKGFCLNKDMAQTVNAADWGVSWYYNWNMEAFKYTSFQPLQFVPMMWTSSDTDDKTITRLPKFGYKYVLAYNEPDRVDQSNIEVEEAVEGMKAFMEKGLLVGSPATALCPPWSKAWFQPFMKQLNEGGMDVDFIAVHHYWNWFHKEGAQAFLDLIDETYEMYHKPIWITEFAISGDPGKNEMQLEAVENYMKMVLPELDKRDYVERYAWFSFNPHDKRNGASALLQTYTGEITGLGRFYQKLGMPEGYGDTNVVCNEINPKNEK